MAPRHNQARFVLFVGIAILALVAIGIGPAGQGQAGPLVAPGDKRIFLPISYGRLQPSPTVTATPRATATPTIPTTPGSWSSVASPKGIAFYAVDIVGNDVWVVGDRGTVLRSTNSGASFSQVSVDSDADLFGVDFLDSQFGVVVGVAGTIRWTKDGGKTWTFGGGTRDEALGAVTLVDANTGWASGGGGTILKTTDGGRNWQRQDSGFDSDINSIWFVDSSNGWAVGNGGIILATTNGGASWFRQKQPGSDYDSLSGVFFRDRQNGFAGGDPSSNGGGFQSNLWRTTNGGAGWGRVGLPMAGPAITAIRFADANRGWLAAEERIILRTTSGGGSWTVEVPPLQPGGVHYWFYGIAVRFDGAAVAVGASYPDNGSFDVIDSVIMRRTAGT